MRPQINRKLLSGFPSSARPPVDMVRRLAELASKPSTLLAQPDLQTLQIWKERDPGLRDGSRSSRMAIAFVDLVGYSEWALRVGDDLALEMLSEASDAIESAVHRRRGKVVRRLGDGVMAVFQRPDHATLAMLDARDRVDEIDLGGYRPQLRAGIHLGDPRLLRSDYVGVDVNVAARLAGAALGGELLVSGDALAEMDHVPVSVRRRRSFRAAGSA